MHAFIYLFVKQGFGLSDTSGAHLTKAYDLTIQRYHKSPTKMKKNAYFVVYGYKILDAISEAPPPPKKNKNKYKKPRKMCI